MSAYEYTTAIGAQERGILLPWNFLKLYYYLCALKSLPLAHARVLPLKREKFSFISKSLRFSKNSIKIEL
jgi:hypothetical protein